MPIVLFNPQIGPYQVLPHRARVNLGAMAMKGCSAFPKPQHYWNLTIRLFSVISRTLTVFLPLCRLGKNKTRHSSYKMFSFCVCVKKEKLSGVKWREREDYLYSLETEKSLSLKKFLNSGVKWREREDYLYSLETEKSLSLKKFLKCL